MLLGPGRFLSKMGRLPHECRRGRGHHDFLQGVGDDHEHDHNDDDDTNLERFQRLV